jgi:hypothetical protein
MDRIIDLIKKGVPLLVVAAIGYMGEHGTDGGFIKDIWTAAKTASPLAAMFAVLCWLDERRERREAQRQCNERTIDYVKSTNAASAMFDKALAKILAVGGKPRGRRR